MSVIIAPQNQAHTIGLSSDQAVIVPSGADSDFTLIQDTNRAFDSADYTNLLAPLLSGKADVVLAIQTRPPAALERLVAIVAGIELNGSLGGCQAFRTSLGQTIPLRCKGAPAAAERIVQFSRRHARFAQVPVTGGKRSAAPGLCFLRSWLFGAAHTDPAADILLAMSLAHRFNRWMADTLKPFLTGDVLEVGAGIGNLTVLLAAAGQVYTATDTNAEHLAELHARTAHMPDVELALCDFTNADDITRFHQSADTIVCLNALEHIPDDQSALTNLRSCLRPGGKAIVLVPQSPALFGSLDEVLEHQRRYTKEELERKMILAGFRVNRILEFNHATWPGWFLNSRLLRRRTFSRFQLRLFDLLVPLWRRIDHLLPWPSTSIIAITHASR